MPLWLPITWDKRKEKKYWAYKSLMKMDSTIPKVGAALWYTVCASWFLCLRPLGISCIQNSKHHSFQNKTMEAIHKLTESVWNQHCRHCTKAVGTTATRRKVHLRAHTCDASDIASFLLLCFHKALSVQSVNLTLYSAFQGEFLKSQPLNELNFLSSEICLCSKL